MGITSRVVRVVDTVGKAGGWFGLAACFIMMVLVVANVILRFSWQSIPGTLDVTESLMTVIAVMFLAYTQARRGHINVELVINYLPVRTRQALGFFTTLLALGFAICLAWQSWLLGWGAWQVKESAGTHPFVPYYPAKLLLAVGVSLLCIQLILDVWREATNLRSAARSK